MTNDAHRPTALEALIDAETAAEALAVLQPLSVMEARLLILDAFDAHDAATQRAADYAFAGATSMAVQALGFTD